MTEFAAAAAADGEPAFVVAGDFTGALVLGELVPVTELAEGSALFAVPAELGAALPVCLASPLPLGVALMLRALPPVLADDAGVVPVGVSAPDVDVDVADADALGLRSLVGDGDGDGEVDDEVVGVDVVEDGDTVVGGGGAGVVVVVLVGVGVGVGEWLGDGPDLDFKSSHCWLVPVTTDAVCTDTAAEALGVPGWSAEATKE